MEKYGICGHFFRNFRRVGIQCVAMPFPSEVPWLFKSYGSLEFHIKRCIWYRCAEDGHPVSLHAFVSLVLEVDGVHVPAAQQVVHTDGEESMCLGRQTVRRFDVEREIHTEIVRDAYPVALRKHVCGHSGGLAFVFRHRHGLRTAGAVVHIERGTVPVGELIVAH